MKQFTIITEFNSGTSIHQVYGLDEVHASEVWDKELSSEILKGQLNVEYLLERKKIKLPPVLIKGMNNVWCNDITIENKYLSQTIVLSCKNTV